LPNRNKYLKKEEEEEEEEEKKRVEIKANLLSVFIRTPYFIIRQLISSEF